MPKSSHPKIPEFVLKMHELCESYEDVISASEAISEMEEKIEKFHAAEKEIIKKARQELDFSMDEVADFYHIKKEQLRRMETQGYHFPQKDYIDLWCTYCLVYALRQVKYFDAHLADFIKPKAQ